jgi:hypothetical protein
MGRDVPNTPDPAPEPWWSWWWMAAPTGIALAVAAVIFLDSVVAVVVAAFLVALAGFAVFGDEWLDQWLG